MFNVEKIQAPVGGRKWRRQKEWKQKHKDKKQQKHYSEKPNHANRSVANDPHKRSKRRGNY